MADRLRTASRRPLPASTDGRELERYRKLRRNMTLLMILVTVVPLTAMALINYYEHRKTLESQTVSPLRALLNRTRHSCELFLAERRSAVSFVASTYGFEQLEDPGELQRVFQVLRREFGGFVDLGLIDTSGRQVAYAGPYDLVGKDYAGQEWFVEVGVRGTYTSEVFMGHRRYPHFVIAVQHVEPGGRSWIVRATVDTEKFNSLVAGQDREGGSDLFVVNHQNVLQTPSRYYGSVLDRFSTDVPESAADPAVIETTDREGRKVLLGYVRFETAPFTLVAVMPYGSEWQPWHTLKNEIFLIFVGSVLAILFVVHRLTSLSVRRIERSERRERQAFLEMQHASRLASIGRLAAGVAHEINNPLAIIDQKAGLMADLLAPESEFALRGKFSSLTESIAVAVDRCRTITHRLLGFAKRMDVEMRAVDVNEVIREVLGFLEQEAMHRNMGIRLDLAPDLPRIVSDHGQLQQVFLNLLNNAFAATDEGGRVSIRTKDLADGRISVEVQDDGTGMSEETRRRIFEPFFTTKREQGTGLGLSVTYGIVQKLGCDIRVQSRLDEGSTFIVTLPVSPEEQTGV